MSQNLPQIYTSADAVQICGNFWDTQYQVTMGCGGFPVKLLKRCSLTRSTGVPPADFRVKIIFFLSTERRYSYEFRQPLKYEYISVGMRRYIWPSRDAFVSEEACGIIFVMWQRAGIRGIHFSSM